LYIEFSAPLIWYNGGLYPWFQNAVLSDGRATGAEITRRIEEMSNYYWHPLQGSIYLLLKDLARDGYIEIEEENGNKYYKITKEGCIMQEVYSEEWGANKIGFEKQIRPHVIIG
jgi:DNA-binding PadR family transcriptional regulator